MEAELNRLKRHLIKTFIVILLAIGFCSSLLDGVNEIIMDHTFNTRLAAVVIILFLVIHVLIYVFFILLFVRLVSKKIEEENVRYNKERNTLFANIAHDLKTPMTTVIGFSKALYDGEVKSEKERKELLYAVYTKSKKANELLDLMFQYTKLEGIDYNLILKEENIGAIIREIIALYYNQFEEKNIELVIDIPDEPLKMQVDRIEFSRAISNLIINAYRHNEEGSTVLIRLQKQDGIRIVVADTGKAIPMDMKKQIFEPFVCGDESRNENSGSGLGLAITKIIVEKHCGTIQIDSSIEGYSKGFVIIFGAATTYD